MFEKILFVAITISCYLLLILGYAEEAVFFAVACLWTNIITFLKMQRRLEELEKELQQFRLKVLKP